MMRLKKIGPVLERICVNPYVFCFILGILLNIGVEALSRKSLVAVALYAAGRPVIFLYNSLAIAFTASFALLIKRRVFAFSFISVIWLGMGLVNSILLIFRTTPFTAVDILLVKSAYSIMGTYFTGSQIILLAAGALVAFILIAVLFFKAPKRREKINYQNVAFFIGGMFAFLYFITLGGMEAGALGRNFGNIGAAYVEYGFPYCFGNSLLNTGINRPRDYSPEVVDELIAEAEEPVSHNYSYVGNGMGGSREGERTNIIYLQLESFFDPSYVTGAGFSTDPIPCFRGLKETYPSGFLNVPSIGAGTANTEFEVITGMNLDFFGPGEYPYKTILMETSCESVAYNLKELGYKAHAIHNNEGTFYGRNQVFSQLGFDTFTSVEYMWAEDYTPMGWAKDHILTGEITKALKSTAEKDVIYTISVQGHGSYPSEQMENPAVALSGLEEWEKRNSFEYYVNQLHEMDEFLRQLTIALTEYPERVVLVLFGDHLPGFGFTNEDLENGDIYQTEYIIWSNFNMEKQDRDLEAYQLSAYTMELLGLHNGILTKYHQAFYSREDYLEGLELLEYDMLYGKQEVYGGVNPYEITDIVMGMDPIAIKYAEKKIGYYEIKGLNFTEFSRIMVNGSYVDTQYVDPYTLRFTEELEEGDEISVHQVGKDNTSLSHTDSYRYMPDHSSEED